MRLYKTSAPFNGLHVPCIVLNRFESNSCARDGSLTCVRKEASKIARQNLHKEESVAVYDFKGGPVGILQRSEIWEAANTFVTAQ